MHVLSKARALVVGALGLVACAVSAPLSAQNPNLVPNAEFHQNDDGWTSTAGYSAFDRDTFDWTECGALSGSALFGHFGPAGSQTAFARVCVPAVDDGVVHSFGGYLRFLTGQTRTGSATVEVSWLSGPDCTGTPIETSVATTRATTFAAGTWVLVKADASFAPAGAQSASFAIELVKNEAGGSLELRVDGLYLVARPGFVFRDGFGLNSTCRWSSELP